MCVSSRLLGELPPPPPPSSPRSAVPAPVRFRPSCNWARDELKLRPFMAGRLRVGRRHIVKTAGVDSPGVRFWFRQLRPEPELRAPARSASGFLMGVGFWRAASGFCCFSNGLTSDCNLQIFLLDSTDRQNRAEGCCSSEG